MSNIYNQVDFVFEKTCYEYSTTPKKVLKIFNASYGIRKSELVSNIKNDISKKFKNLLDSRDVLIHLGLLKPKK